MITTNIKIPDVTIRNTVINVNMFDSRLILLESIRKRALQRKRGNTVEHSNDNRGNNQQNVTANNNISNIGGEIKYLNNLNNNISLNINSGKIMSYTNKINDGDKNVKINKKWEKNERTVRSRGQSNNKYRNGNNERRHMKYNSVKMEGEYSFNIRRANINEGINDKK